MLFESDKSPQNSLHVADTKAVRSLASRLFVHQFFGLTATKKPIKTPHCWSRVYYLHKGPTMRRAFPCNGAIVTHTKIKRSSRVLNLFKRCWTLQILVTAFKGCRDDKTRWTFWRHQMETCFSSLSLCKGNPPITDGFPSQMDSKRAFDVSLLSVWTNTRWTGDSRRHDGHLTSP